jgi:nucleoside-diphosphate-sugar epimerase
MKKVLVTGAGGFIGRYCLPLLLEKGYEVHAVSTGKTENSEITWHRADLLDLRQSRLLTEKIQPTHLLHLAWDAVPGKYWSSAENFSWVQASLELLKAFQENSGKRVVMAGTCAEYDWSYGLCSEESTPLNPASVYGTCKSALQKLSEAFARLTGISAAWGRIFFAYGPGEYNKKLISAITRNLLMNKAADCSSGSQVRDFVYAGDVASAFVTLLETDVRGAFNIASGQPVAIREIIDLVAEKLDGRELIRMGKVTPQVNEPPVLTADISKIMSETGWRPQFSLEEGITETIDWWKKKINHEPE